MKKGQFYVLQSGPSHGRRKGGGKGHVTPPKALKGGVRGGKSLRLLSNLFSSFCNNVSLPII